MIFSMSSILSSSILILIPKLTFLTTSEIYFIQKLNYIKFIIMSWTIHRSSSTHLFNELNFQLKLDSFGSWTKFNELIIELRLELFFSWLSLFSVLTLPSTLRTIILIWPSFSTNLTNLSKGWRRMVTKSHFSNLYLSKNDNNSKRTQWQSPYKNEFVSWSPYILHD